jgi:PleD family two-component response regulator
LLLQQPYSFCAPARRLKPALYEKASAKRECSMAGPTSQRRVLVVEDDASIRELLRLHLDLAGFTIDEAGEGRSFDLVLLDVMLPGLDGVSICRALRNGGPSVLIRFLRQLRCLFLGKMCAA